MLEDTEEGSEGCWEGLSSDSRFKEVGSVEDVRVGELGTDLVVNPWKGLLTTIGCCPKKALTEG